MRETPDPIPYRDHLPAVYRFAFLMTGNAAAAAEVLRHTVEEAEREGLGDLRNPRQVRRWLFTHARSACRRPHTVARPVPTAATDEASFLPAPDASASVPTLDAASDSSEQLALLFGGLPEAERGAAILFYLYLFTPVELAEVLEIKPDDLGTLLTRSRALLQRQKVPVC